MLEYKIYKFLLIFFSLLMIVTIFVSVYRTLSLGIGNKSTVRCTVTDKGIKRINEKDVYLIYADTDNGVEVFQITDSLYAFRFNSADVYAEIKVGKTYDFGVRGKRNTLLSWYRNIYDVKEVVSD